MRIHKAKDMLADIAVGIYDCDGSWPLHLWLWLYARNISHVSWYYNAYEKRRLLILVFYVTIC